MSLSPLKKLVLPPVLISTAVFSVLSVPLALFGSKPVTIQLQEEPLFHGPLRDIATPYLGLATALSLGAGVACAAVTGWQQSSQKTAKAEEQLSGLQQHLKAKEELLEELRLSESRLEAFGLSEFLDNSAVEAPAPSAATPQFVAQPVVVQLPVEVVEPVVIGTPTAQFQSPQPQRLTVQAAAAAFPSAQAFLGFAPAGPTANREAAPPARSEIAELQSQLQQIMAQMELLQTALEKTPQLVTPAVVPFHSVVPLPSRQIAS